MSWNSLTEEYRWADSSDLHVQQMLVKTNEKYPVGLNELQQFLRESNGIIL